MARHLLEATREQPGYGPEALTLLDPLEVPQLLRAIHLAANSHSGQEQRQIDQLPFNVFEPADYKDQPNHTTTLEARSSYRLERSDPVATARQVKRATGMDLGPLAAMIDLPYPPMLAHQRTAEDDSARRVYVFDLAQRSYAEQQQQQDSRLLVIGLREIEMLRQRLPEGEQISQESLEALGVHALIVERGKPGVLGRDSDCWMPIAQDSKHTTSRNGMPEVYRGVAHRQTSINVDIAGEVTIANLNLNPTVVWRGNPKGGLVLATSDNDALRAAAPWAMPSTDDGGAYRPVTPNNSQANHQSPSSTAGEVALPLPQDPYDSKIVLG